MASPYSIPFWESIYGPIEKAVSGVADIFRTQLGEAGMSEVAPFIQKGITSSARDITRAATPPKTETTGAKFSPPSPATINVYASKTGDWEARTSPVPNRNRASAIPTSPIGEENTEYMRDYPYPYATANTPLPTPARPEMPGYTSGFLTRGPGGELVPATLNPWSNMYEPTRTGPMPTRPDINFETMGQYGARRAMETALPEPSNEVYRLNERGELVPFKRYTSPVYGGSEWMPGGQTAPATPPTSPFYSVGPRGALPIGLEEFNRRAYTRPGEGGTVETIFGGRRGLERYDPTTGRMVSALPIGERFPELAPKLELEKAKGEAQIAHAKQLGINRQDEIRLLAQVGKKSREEMAAEVYAKTVKDWPMADVTGKPIPGAAEAHAQNVRNFVDSLYMNRRETAEKALTTTGKYNKEQIKAFLDAMGY